MYSIKDIMLMYGMSERTIRRHLSSGLITGQKVGGVWRFTDEDIETSFSEKNVRSKMKTEVNKLLYDYLNTPNPQKEANHCFSMIDLRITSKEHKELQYMIFKTVSESTNLTMKYYNEDGNYRYVFIGDLPFVEKVTSTIHNYTKKAAN